MGDNDDYVVGANTVIDKIGMEGYDQVTDDRMELYTAFYSDLNLEIQGGRYFKGHEILNFEDGTVYDKGNFEALTDGNDATTAEPKTNPSDFNSSMVFALNEIPVEMSKNYRLFVDYVDYSSNPDDEVVSYLEKVEGTALYAWEYEKQKDGTYKRVRSIPITAEDFEINDDSDTMYVNLGLGHIDTTKYRLDQFDELASDPNNATYTITRIRSYLSQHPDMKKDYYQHVPTLSGLVRLDGSKFKDSSNPIAIAAMCYDATATEEKDLYKTVSADSTGEYTYNEYSWHNNKGFALTFAVSDDSYYYGRSGEVTYTKYWSDEPYYASSMGSFSLQPYMYRFTDKGNEHTLTLYNVYPYFLFARRIQENYHIDYDNWKAADHSQENLLIDTWEIPATYTDPLSGTVYNVRIAKGGNIVPQYASKLIIEDGVGFPDDCSYLFSSLGNLSVRMLSEIVIQGETGSVGSNITNMSYMFLGKTGRQGFDATEYASLDFAALDTSNVTDMSFMFADVTMTNRANIDVTTLDTSKVTNFKGMFRSYHVPSGLFQPNTALDLSHFNTESAEDMSEMFEGSTFSALDLSGFDFSKVTDMSRMFTFIEYLESITFPADMDSSKVTDMSFMFAGDYNLSQIGNLTAMDTGSVTDMSGMFGAHQCNKKLIETIPVYMDPEVWSGSYQYDKFLDGFAVFSPTWVTVKLYNVNDGPAITSLDLTGFDTGKVKYANGMFYMPKLSEIKWGESTTFESLSDAGGMFTLASIKKLDLTGRKFSNIKFANSRVFPAEMFNLNQATELVLGKDSINLSKLSPKGQLMINAPELYSLDFRNVTMGTNALAGEGVLNSGSPSSLQGASGLYEIYLPAGMPLLTSPMELPGKFYDEEGNAYNVINSDDENACTVIKGGYENELHLVNPDKERKPQTITADDVTVTYGDTDKAVSAGVTDPAEGGGEITYAVKAGSEDYIYVDASTGALTIWAVPADGKAYVVVTAAKNQPYAEVTKEVTVTIAKAKITPIVSMTGWTYGSTANAPSVTGNSGNAEVTYTYAVKGSGEYSAAVPTAVGDYTVKAVIAATENYEGASVTTDFTIRQAETSGDTNTDTKPNDPTTQNPTTQDPIKQNPATQDPKEAGADTPKEEGAVITDQGTGATYEVTDDKGQVPSVAYKGTDSGEKNVEIPETVQDGKVTYKVTKIADGAFKDNKTMESIKIPESVARIGDRAFLGCTNLKIVKLPASVIQIGNKAFGGCKNLKTVTIGKNVSSIGDSAFANCPKLTKVTLPSKVAKLGKNLFKSCKNLKNINIKSKKLIDKSIAKGAFKGLGKDVIIKVPAGRKNAYEKLFRKKGLSRKVKIK
ncbi:MAG: leucine-rich repeat protein [Lachnospiraceae bacterium]|nr:leucine-rich repeat protein [Lachnospiraceae bacterium]